MTEVEDWKRQMILLEDDNFDLYRQLQESKHEVAKLKVALVNARANANLLKEAQQEGIEF